MPASLFQGFYLFFLSNNISIDFLRPITLIRLGKYSIPTTLMMMPKATIDKNHCMTSSNNYIWFARKILSMKPVVDIHRGQDSAD